MVAYPDPQPLPPPLDYRGGTPADPLPLPHPSTPDYRGGTGEQSGGEAGSWVKILHSSLHQYGCALARYQDLVLALARMNAPELLVQIINVFMILS